MDSKSGFLWLRLKKVGSDGSIAHVLAGLAAAAELGGGGEQHVGGGVQSGLAGVLDHADDKADGHHLHGHVIGDAEQGAGQGDQQQGAAGHAGGPAGGHGGHQAEEEGGGEVHLDAHGVGGGQGQHSDGDGGAGHVDGGSQGDGDGVLVLVQAQLFAQLHVHGDICGGAAGEEGHDAAVPQALEDQRIGVLPDADEDDDGVDHQGHEEHAAHQHQDQPAVGLEGVKAGGGHGVEDQTQNTEGGAADDPADGGAHSVGDIAQHLLGALARVPEGQTEYHGPQQDAHVVGVDNGGDGVADGVVQQVGDDLTDAAGGGALRRLIQQEGGGESEAGHHGAQGGHEGAHQVEDDDRLHVAAGAALVLGQGVHDQEEDQQGGQGLQGAHEQRAQNADGGCGGDQRTQERAQDKAEDNAFDQADAVPLLDQFHSFDSFLFCECDKMTFKCISLAHT